MDSQNQKSALREAIKKRMGQMTQKEQEAESRSVSRRVLDAIPEGVPVCAYMPIRNEVDITPVLEELFSKGVPLYFPRLENNKTAFRRVDDLGQLTPGSYDIPEPPSDAEALSADGKVIALIPGRAFDRSGGRLGRGNGGYDHWIADERVRNTETEFWGICFENQLVSEAPREAHDQLVDAVWTARGRVESP